MDVWLCSFGSFTLMQILCHCFYLSQSLNQFAIRRRGWCPGYFRLYSNLFSLNLQIFPHNSSDLEKLKIEGWNFILYRHRKCWRGFFAFSEHLSRNWFNRFFSPKSIAIDHKTFVWNYSRVTAFAISIAWFNSKTRDKRFDCLRDLSKSWWDLDSTQSLQDSGTH